MPALPTSALPRGCVRVVVTSLAQDMLYAAPHSMTPPAFPQHAHPQPKQLTRIWDPSKRQEYALYLLGPSLKQGKTNLAEESLQSKAS